METESQELERYARGYVTVNLDAIVSNMRHMKANLAEQTKMMGVIKTDGYGHGAIPIARQLENLDFVFGYAVATPEEAGLLRRAGIKKPILILGYTFPYCYEKLVEEQIRPAVFRYDALSALGEIAARMGKTIHVHIKVDTGMNRIGIRPDEAGLAFVQKALETPGITVEGIFTHFARADETDKTAAKQQLVKFKNFCKEIQEKLGVRIPIQHCSNSAGIVEMRDANMDMVRAGITLYGLWPSDEVRQDIVKLTPALSWYTHISYIKEVEPGNAVSYGGTYTVEKPMRIATIPVGYGDGYPRGLSNKGYVLINGKKAPILGRVCMDQFMVDVTRIPEAKEGALVTLIGRDGEEQITMEKLGDLSGRFNYELACDIGKRIPRVYLEKGEIVETRDWF
mgnify:CR=1 FL=1